MYKYICTCICIYNIFYFILDFSYCYFLLVLVGLLQQPKVIFDDFWTHASNMHLWGFYFETPLGPKCFHDAAGAIDFTPLHCHFRRGGRSAFIASPKLRRDACVCQQHTLSPSLYCRVVHTLGNDQKRRPVKTFSLAHCDFLL